MKYALPIAVCLGLLSAQVGFAKDAPVFPKPCGRMEDRRLKGQCMAENAKYYKELADKEAAAQAKAVKKEIAAPQPKLVPCPRTDDRRARAECYAKNAKILQEFTAKQAIPIPFLDTSGSVKMSCARLEDAKEKARCMQKQNTSR